MSILAQPALLDKSVPETDRTIKGPEEENLPDGSKYEGIYVNGKREGQGKL